MVDSTETSQEYLGSRQKFDAESEPLQRTLDKEYLVKLQEWSHNEDTRKAELPGHNQESH